MMEPKQVPEIDLGKISNGLWWILLGICGLFLFITVAFVSLVLVVTSQGLGKDSRILYTFIILVLETASLVKLIGIAKCIAAVKGKHFFKYFAVFAFVSLLVCVVGIAVWMGTEIWTEVDLEEIFRENVQVVLFSIVTGIYLASMIGMVAYIHSVANYVKSSKGFGLSAALFYTAALIAISLCRTCADAVFMDDRTGGCAIGIVFFLCLGVVLVALAFYANAVYYLRRVLDDLQSTRE